MEDRTMKFRNAKRCGGGNQLGVSPAVPPVVFAIMFALIGLIGQASLVAQQPQWIWSPKATGLSQGSSLGDCYFRSKFTLIKPERAEIEFAAGDEFEVYINNRLLSKGESYGSANKLDLSGYLRPGVNLVAVKVRHNSGLQPGLSMKIRIKEEGETRWRSLITDKTWKTRRELISAWKQNAYNDMGWLNAKTIVVDAGTSEAAVVTSETLGIKSTPKPPATVSRSAVPVVSPAEAAAKRVAPSAQVAVKKTVAPKETFKTRFELDSEFSIQQVLGGKETGSIVAMEFNEFGKLLFSRENGPLMMADLALPVGSPGRVRVYCDKVKNCGGILPVNGTVYVTGHGPSGLALYRLADADNDGKLEPNKALFKFTGKAGTHGPHALRLGPDAKIYMVLGNGAQVDKKVSANSPYGHAYEGFGGKRIEDPSGQAVGVKAPGGTVVRCSLDGTDIETFAGGLRNAADLVFDANGELFIHDSDNPADIGTPWYRPSMLFHVAAGAELGWRSGSAKLPSYLVDVTQPVCEVGSAAPTGAVIYRHLQFPSRFHNTIFSANRATGEILAMRTERNGAGFSGTAETFLRGKSFDVTDLAVGEDGSLYVATGSRGNSGGLYRVLWNGDVPENLLDFDNDLTKVIRHPQPDAPWARQNIAELKIALGREWNKSIRGVATEPRNPARFRVRAMRLMVMYGPAPDASMLSSLAKETDPEIRAQAAKLCAASGSSRHQTLLQGLLSDSEPFVRRIAAEAMLTMKGELDFPAIAGMLSSDDRTEAAVARRLLERISTDQWKNEILTTDDKRLFVQGALALAIADPSLENSYKVLARGSSFMDGFVNDIDFVDMLRAMELSLIQSDVDPVKIPGFATRIANEFPAGNSRINQELARLLGVLQVGNLEGRLEAHFENDEVVATEKLNTALQLHASGKNLTGSERLAILRYLDSIQSNSGVGDSYSGYVRQIIENCGSGLSAEQASEILANPKLYPGSLISAFYQVPAELDEQTYKQLIEIDQLYSGKQDEQSNQIRLGVIALLAQGGDESAMVHLRNMWQKEPQRRSDIGIGLAQQPDGENWSYLVSTLPLIDNDSAPEVLTGLLSVARKPRDPRHYRDLITAAENLNKVSSRAALRLLEHWAGEKLNADAADDSVKIASWKKWCDQNLSATTASEGTAKDRF